PSCQRGARLLVKPLGVTPFAHFDRRAHVHLDERNRTGVVLLVDGPGRVPVLAVQADEAGQRDESRVNKELCHLADATDVLLALLGREAEAESLRRWLRVAARLHQDLRPG